MKCYWCSLISGSLELREASDAKWLTAESMDSVKWLEADSTILEKIKQNLQEETGCQRKELSRFYV